MQILHEHAFLKIIYIFNLRKLAFVQLNKVDMLCILIILLALFNTVFKPVSRYGWNFFLIISRLDYPLINFSSFW